MSAHKAQWIVLVVALLLVGAFVVSFGMRLQQQAAPPAKPIIGAPPVPEINSGKRVEVLNAAGTSGLARQATEQLRAAGFDVVFLGNARRRVSESVAIDRVGKPELARAVSQSLGIARTETHVDSTRHVEVTVILGTDWPPAATTSR
jgi:hypothetical protein